ncbi:hypothetical protein PAHAL_4G006700 [Panicum hallii]|uniref:Uncharacterized protein n=1 Tax=Panicum hallii TaxID=206008 RepID=A0A2T8JBC8_9POAL|nr:hypothetical protein PAHAL_4G006700 [Panicum hallii]
MSNVVEYHSSIYLLPQCPDSPARKNKNAMSLSLRIEVPKTGAILVLFSGLALAAFLCRRS